eukprot:scaffold12987_cov56-Cyclotella_meneghiniana.AAC.2
MMTVSSVFSEVTKSLLTIRKCDGISDRHENVMGPQPLIIQDVMESVTDMRMSWDAHKTHLEECDWREI